MEKLVTRGITYKGLRELFNKDDELIKQTLYNLKNKDLNIRLFAEADAYWANILKVDVKDVYYGDILLKDGQTLDHKYLIGRLVIPEGAKCNTDNLVGVIGSIKSNGTKTFRNLEFVSSYIYFEATHSDVRTPVILPKLKYCNDITLYHCTIKELALERVNKANLSLSRIKDFHIKVANELRMSSAHVQDISSLEEVNILNIRSIPSTQLIYNPNLVIYDHFICVQNKEFVAKLSKHLASNIEKSSLY